MINLFSSILILIGYLSPVNDGIFERVVEYRKTKPVEYPIDKKLNTTEYECLVGLPYGYKHLIGRTVYFYDNTSSILRGPWLVVDVESATNKNQMLSRKLIADVSCKEYKSHYGIIVLYDER